MMWILGIMIVLCAWFIVGQIVGPSNAEIFLGVGRAAKKPAPPPAKAQLEDSDSVRSTIDPLIGERNP